MPTPATLQNNQPSNTPTKTKIACIGDSITELSGYPNILQQLLGSSFTVGNFGACGTTASLSSESPYMRSRAYTSASDFQPDHAIVMLGTNDANPNFDNYSGLVTDYLLLIEALKSLTGKPKVWIVRPPHIFDESWLSGRILSSKIIPAIDEVAKKAKLPMIDVYSAADNPRLFFDGVHPNDEGAETIANVVYQTILRDQKSQVF